MIKNGMIPGERNGNSLHHSCPGNPTEDPGVLHSMGWQRDATQRLNNSSNNYVYIQKAWKSIQQTAVLTGIRSGSRGWGILYLLTVDIFSFKFFPHGMSLTCNILKALIKKKLNSKNVFNCSVSLFSSP